MVNASKCCIVCATSKTWFITFTSDTNVLPLWHSWQSASHRHTQMYDGWSSSLTISCWAQWVTWAFCASRSAFTTSLFPHSSAHTNPFDSIRLPTLAQSQLLGGLLAGVSDSWLAIGYCTIMHNRAAPSGVWVCVLQDTSTGQIIAQHRTKMGPCDVLRHNPYNAVSLLGHAQGVVTMWTPNMTSPVVKMLAHRVICLAYNHAPVQSLCAVPRYYGNSCTSHFVSICAVSALLVHVHLHFSTLSRYMQ